MYQLFRSLAYIHSLGICHRDIKPQNLLLDPETAVLKLCDFGSAKQLLHGEPNVSYICSRYYRAPELIFGAINYTTKIGNYLKATVKRSSHSPSHFSIFFLDVWSAGCVLAELLLGQPIFPGDSGVDQLVEIIKVLGTPTREQIKEMNPNYTEFKFPQIKSHPWQKVSGWVIDCCIQFFPPTAQYRPLLHYYLLNRKVWGSIWENGRLFYSSKNNKVNNLKGFWKLFGYSHDFSSPKWGRSGTIGGGFNASAKNRLFNLQNTSKTLLSSIIVVPINLPLESYPLTSYTRVLCLNATH